MYHVVGLLWCYTVKPKGVSLTITIMHLEVVTNFCPTEKDITWNLPKCNTSFIDTATFDLDVTG